MRLLRDLIQTPFVIFLPVFTLFFGLNCTNITSYSSNENGGGTGVGNGRVVGKVMYSDSTPVTELPSVCVPSHI